MDVNISGGGRRPSGSTGSGSNCELLSYGTKTGFLQNRYTKNQQLKNSRSVTGLNSTEASFGNAYHSGNTYTLNRPSSHNQPASAVNRQINQKFLKNLKKRSRSASRLSASCVAGEPDQTGFGNLRGPVNPVSLLNKPAFYGSDFSLYESSVDDYAPVSDYTFSETGSAKGFEPNQSHLSQAKPAQNKPTPQQLTYTANGERLTRNPDRSSKPEKVTLVGFTTTTDTSDKSVNLSRNFRSEENLYNNNSTRYE